MKKICIVIFLLCLSAFSPKRESTLIIIQPLGNVSYEYIAQVKKSVKSFYGYECKVLTPIQINNSMLTKRTNRIDASKALKKNSSKGNLLILTEKDICHFKDKKRPEYGIFGLGLRPGKTCIISTFRLKRGVSQQKTLERLEKVALHEIGHNLGLKHCENHKECMMNDANGTIKQVDKEKVWFCEKCKRLIKKR
ncbi:matrixin family metalloprotease [Flavobacterium sp.]|jgi:archaemetzincin|uniref:matrixin family metalloprotease n=1 Tax=Flavobacterium sp. TaxID=239 RepID=UPI0037BF620D